MKDAFLAVPEGLDMQTMGIIASTAVANVFFIGEKSRQLPF